MRPTRRAVALFALSIPVALILLAFRPEWWFAAFYLPVVVLALLAADMSMAPPRGGVTVRTAVPVLLPVGGRGEVAVDLASTRVRRPFAVTALLETEGEVAEAQPERGVARNGQLRLALPLTPLRRGRATVAAIWLRWRGPLGLIEIRRRHAVQSVVNIVIDVRGIHAEALRFFARDAAHGVKSQRPRGEGTEFDKLAEYEKGMDSRFIDWKRSARHRKLLCREFRQERNHQIVFGFDTGRLMLEPLDGCSRLDHAVRAAMLLGWVSLRNGDLVGGCGFDARFRSFIQPGRGMPYFSKLQRFAAGLEYRTEETNHTLGLTELNSRLRRRTLVILFSEFVDTTSAELLMESMQAMLRRHVVVFVAFQDAALLRLRDAAPDRFGDIARAVIADDFLRDRAIVLEKAARLGAHCLDVPAAGLSAALLNRYLAIKQRGLL